MSFKTKFAVLGHPNRVWAIPAIHGQVEQLKSLHSAIFSKVAPGDRIVYTGNYMGGDNADAKETVNEILRFRRALLAQPGMMPEDFVYLRGIQEDLWSKILQIHFAPNPKEIMVWLSNRYPVEIDAILKAYGSSLQEAQRIVREGTISMTKWTVFLKNQIRLNPGHEKFFTTIRRAAMTENRHYPDKNVLFVHAGLNPAVPLLEQGDHFWWASKDFNNLNTPYAPFKTVIRGHDPDRQGINIGEASISIDNGCGFGGELSAALLSDIGDVIEIVNT